MTAAPSAGRRVAVLGLLAAGALGLLGATQPWATVTLRDGRTLSAAGHEVAGGLAIVSLAIVALALVLPLAGLAWRYVLGGLAVVLGALGVVHAAAARGGVDEALQALVAEATGLAGTAQQAEVAELVATGWPTAALAGGALAALAGAWTLLTARSWAARAPRAARYERTGSGLAWDAMDDGEDPTR